MTARRRIAGVAALGLTLSGCIAAAIPVVAGSAMVKSQMNARRAQSAQPAAAAVVRPPPAAPRVAAAKPRTVAPAAILLVPPVPTVPPGMQYLYGSGEAAAGNLQVYHTLASYLESFRFRQRPSMRQVVMNDGASLEQPYFEPCGAKPLAVVVDVDETALLNLGYEANDVQHALNYDDARWQRWEATGAQQVVAVPGAKLALDAARKAGIAVIFNSNRAVASADQTERALNGAGLGPAEHGKTLWLKGDDGGGSAKDGRRWAIATGFCVIAAVGDQLGDFSDLFNDPALSPAARRLAAQRPGLAELWGNGWFVLANPAYGTALKGGIDDVFPADKRWADPGAPRP